MLRSLPLCGILGACLLVAACAIGPGEEISVAEPYSRLIGTRYEVVSERLAALGIYEAPGKPRIMFISLFPGGYGGPEVAFKQHVPRGSVMRVLSVWRQSIPMESGIYYVVDVEGVSFPANVPIRLELGGENSSDGQSPNPSVYRLLK